MHNTKFLRVLSGLAAMLMLMVASMTSAPANTATYYLNQSNVDSVLPDGANYLNR